MSRISQLASLCPMMTSLLAAEHEIHVVSPGWVFLGLGVLFLSVAILMFATHMRLTRRGERTQGVVVDEIVKDGACYPIVEFNDLSGRQRREKIPSSPGPSIGQPMDIIYDPKDPSRVFGASFFNLWVFPLVFGLMGSISLIVGVMILLGKWVARAEQ